MCTPIKVQEKWDGSLREGEPGASRDPTAGRAGPSSARDNPTVREQRSRADPTKSPEHKAIAW